MKHFENNVNDGMSRTDSIETLIDLTSWWRAARPRPTRRTRALGGP